MKVARENEQHEYRKLNDHDWFKCHHVVILATAQVQTTSLLV